MSQLRIGLAQFNPTTGALDKNMSRILEQTRSACAQGAHLVAFGRLAMTGVGTANLSERLSFRTAARDVITQLAERLVADGMGGATVVVGGIGSDETGAVVDRVFVLHQGAVVTSLDTPLKGSSAEQVPAPAAVSFEVQGKRIVLSTSISNGQGASSDVPTADLLLIVDAAAYVEGRPTANQAATARSAAAAQMPLAYVNLVGGQDALVLSGGSHLTSATGSPVARAGFFEEELQVLDLPAQDTRPGPSQGVSPALDRNAELYAAIVVGLRDYVTKNGFRSVVLGLSGGIDSALLAVLAADALGGKSVVGVSMPSAYSSEHSKVDAADLAERIGANLVVHPIESMVDVFTDALDLQGVAEENLQARVRGLILMGLSNSHGHLVLAPGNKSELAVGYSTIYGDAVGGYAPLKDVFKSRVWELARWRNNYALDEGLIPPIPESSITKPPSAELRPGQVDQDSLPPYEILDAILAGYVEDNHGRGELLTQGFAAEIIDQVITLVDRAEWKRQQYPMGPKLTRVAFGEDRIMPITNGWRETAPHSNDNQPHQGAEHDAP